MTGCAILTGQEYMRLEFTTTERLAAYGLLADRSTDIILKTDGRGFVLAATPALEQLGLALPTMLIGPHVRDLVHPEYRDLIEQEHRFAMAGQGSEDWLEIRAVRAGHKGPWFEFQVRPMCNQTGQIDGALLVMRCIARRKSLEERLFAAEFTDPLTRLTNRIAFVAMLDHLVSRRHQATLALFDIDHFMRLNMRFGQNAGDDLLVAFAGLLRAMTRGEDIISRVSGERFGVIMPGLGPEAAAQACGPIVETFAEAGRATLGGACAVSTSVGITAIALSADNTVKQAELALFLAKAKGRSRIETSPSSAETGLPRALAGRCS